MTVSLETTIGGGKLKLPCCIYNASGPRTGSSAAMAKIAASQAGAVLSKSATIASQKGNPQPRTWHDTHENPADSMASLNSEGLPNQGIDYYISDEVISETFSASENSKPYIVSISGKTLEDNLKMLEKIFSAVNEGRKIDSVELNLACPNVIGKPIIGYDWEQMEEVLAAVKALFDDQQKGKGSVDAPTLPLGVKLPPYLDLPHFELAANIINRYVGLVSYVVSINTLGNAMAVDSHSQMPVISAKGGLAGLSGRAIKHTALANVATLRRLLDSTIDVVGVGGVSSGTDAFEMMLVGAAAVQVGTQHWTEGPSCFNRIASELQDILQSKGYTRATHCCGKLQPWSKEGAAATRALRQAQKKSSSINSTKKTVGVSGRNSLNNTLVHILPILMLIGFLVQTKMYSSSTDFIYFENSVSLEDIYFGTSLLLAGLVFFLLSSR